MREERGVVRRGEERRRGEREEERIRGRETLNYNKGWNTREPEVRCKAKQTHKRQK